MLDIGRLEREVDTLADLPREDLVARWKAAYGCLPPKGVGRDLLVRSAAWHLQVKRLGGLSTETKRRLRAAIKHAEARLEVRSQRSAEGGDIGSAPLAAPSHDAAGRTAPTPGARLIRVWNDRTHVVDVIEGGYVFDGKIYRSLSAIAKRITGAHWSGPRFFGL